MDSLNAIKDELEPLLAGRAKELRLVDTRVEYRYR